MLAGRGLGDRAAPVSPVTVRQTGLEERSPEVRLDGCCGHLVRPMTLPRGTR
jgi:hypothetical protein